MSRTLDGGPALSPVTDRANYSAVPLSQLGAYRPPPRVLWEANALLPLPADDFTQVTVGTGTITSTDAGGCCLVTALPNGAAAIASQRTLGFLTSGTQICVMSCAVDTSTASTNAEGFITFRFAGNIVLRLHIYTTLTGAFVLRFLHSAPADPIYPSRTYAQSSWNVDALDGTGPSRANLLTSGVQSCPLTMVTMTNSSICRIGFVVGGALIIAHEISLARRNATLMTMPIRVTSVEITAQDGNFGTLGPPTMTGTLQMQFLSASVLAEGVEDRRAPTMASASSSGLAAVPSATFASGAPVMLNGIYNSHTVYNTANPGSPNTYLAPYVLLTDITVFNAGGVHVLCRLYHRPNAIAGATPKNFFSTRARNASAVYLPNSMVGGVSVDTTGAVLVMSFVVPAGQSFRAEIREDVARAVALTLDNDVFVLTGISVSGGAADTYSSIGWMEYQ